MSAPALPPPPVAGVPTAGRHRRGPVARLWVGVLTAALLTAGCDLRLETPPPAPLVPDEVEVARQRTVADAVALRVVAESAAGVEGAAAEPVSAALAEVATTSVAHVDALGGIYAPPEPTGPTASASPSATTTAEAHAGSTPEEVVALLRETAASARADASAVPDGRLARVLASVGAARAVLADALVAAGVADIPTPGTDDEDAADEEDPTGGAGEAGPPVPTALPDGLGTGEAGLLVRSEDAAAVAWELLGARVPELRDAAASRAAEHRSRAQDWAVTSGLDTQGLDPRRSQYDLPDALTAGAGTWDAAAARTAVAELERALGALYGTLLVEVAPGARSDLVDALTDSVRAGARLDGVRPSLPVLDAA